MGLTLPHLRRFLGFKRHEILRNRLPAGRILPERRAGYPASLPDPRPTVCLSDIRSSGGRVVDRESHMLGDRAESWLRKPPVAEVCCGPLLGLARAVTSDSAGCSKLNILKRLRFSITPLRTTEITGPCFCGSACLKPRFDFLAWMMTSGPPWKFRDVLRLALI
jgi:hypothetical protein